MVRNSKGFTLIELPIVVVIIGILAAIAIPKFSNTKEKAYVAAMKSDLRNLATYEESYAADNGGVYFDAAGMAASGFRPSQNVTVTPSLANTTSGAASWSAEAAHSSLTGKTCSSSADGVISCTP
ncbi:MAG: type IV pilin protein [Gemmatimonadaceae bacterium]